MNAKNLIREEKEANVELNLKGSLNEVCGW